MKHAGAAAIARLEPLRQRVRGMPGVVERRPGVFYLKSRACLHSHEHGDDLFADLRVDGDEFERLPLSSAADRDALVAALAAQLGSESI